MSASIFWEPVNPRPDRIGTWAPSYFMECMERVGLRLPCTVSRSDIPKIQGMAATIKDDSEAPNPFKEILEALEKHEAISLWAEH